MWEQKEIRKRSAHVTKLRVTRETDHKFQQSTCSTRQSMEREDCFWHLIMYASADSWSHNSLWSSCQLSSWRYFECQYGHWCPSHFWCPYYWDNGTGDQLYFIMILVYATLSIEHDIQVQEPSVPKTWDLMFTSVSTYSNSRPIFLGRCRSGVTCEVIQALRLHATCMNLLLRCDLSQAMDRAGGKAGNKGYECAVTVIEMANLMQDLKDRGLGASAW